MQAAGFDKQVYRMVMWTWAGPEYAWQLTEACAREWIDHWH